MDYIRKYKERDIKLKTSEKYIIITSIIVGILTIALLIGFREEPGKFWGTAGISIMILALAFDAEYWSIENENDILKIKRGVVKIVIPFKNLVNVDSITISNEGHITRKLQILYRKNNRIKRMELTYRSGFIRIANEGEVRLFINTFSEEEKEGYLDIRTKEEEIELEEVLNKQLWGNELQYIEPKKIAIVLISTVVITIGIILCFLIPYIIQCNNY